MISTAATQPASFSTRYQVNLRYFYLQCMECLLYFTLALGGAYQSEGDMYDVKLFM